ncbi:MAG TPA: hypothetical protein VFP56_10950 [Candidatus Limnocylindrales bacterium]|nr:hypothetical protein [Candidatus Limnocylindrales bacterium]
MSASTVQVGGRAEHAVRPTGEGTQRRFQLPRLRPRRIQLRRRHLWLVPGLAIEVVANELGMHHGMGILTVIAIAIAPDVPRIFGSRARPIHNLLHQPALAIGAAAATAVATVVAGEGAIPWLAAGLIWLGHVAAGRGINDMPRPTADRAGEHLDA